MKLCCLYEVRVVEDVTQRITSKYTEYEWIATEYTKTHNVITPFPKHNAICIDGKYHILSDACEVIGNDIVSEWRIGALSKLSPREKELLGIRDIPAI